MNFLNNIKKMKNFLLNIIFDIVPQAAEESVFRSSGKIYVVVGIIAIIFICIVIYLISLDSKISKLEDKSK